MIDDEGVSAASVRRDHVAKRPWPKPPVSLVIALAVALLVTSIGWYKVLRHSHWLSAPQRLAWVTLDGKRLDKGHSCHGDIRFATLVDGDRVWLMCRAVGGETHSALGTSDMARGEARLVAEFPETVHWTAGLLPGPNDTLAIVVAVEKPTGLALGIAKGNGWVRAPTRLPGKGTRRRPWAFSV